MVVQIFARAGTKLGSVKLFPLLRFESSVNFSCPFQTCKNVQRWNQHHLWYRYMYCTNEKVYLRYRLPNSQTINAGFVGSSELERTGQWNMIGYWNCFQTNHSNSFEHDISVSERFRMIQNEPFLDTRNARIKELFLEHQLLIMIRSSLASLVWGGVDELKVKRISGWRCCKTYAAHAEPTNPCMETSLESTLGNHQRSTRNPTVNPTQKEVGLFFRGHPASSRSSVHVKYWVRTAFSVQPRSLALVG